MKLLIQSKAYLNALAWDKSMILYNALQYNRKLHADLVLNNKADLTVMSSKEYLSLHKTAIKGYVLIIDTLLDYNANVNVKSINSQIALHFLTLKSSSLKASDYYHLLWLLIEMSINIDAKDKYEFSAMSIPDSKTDYYFKSLILIS